MDDHRFDSLVRALATDRSRRQVLRGLAGGGVSLVAAHAGSALSASQPKVDICHLTGNGSYRLITVSASAVPAHVAHGDGYPGTDAHCSACGDTCESDERCSDRSCIPTCTIGESCIPPEGAGGEGICQEDFDCCVPSGGVSGGVPGDWCSAVNCCSGGCDPSSLVCY